MVENDSEAAAREAAKMFKDSRVRQFYDPRRAIGLAYVRGPFKDCLDQALDALPPDHSLRPHLESAVTEPISKRRALWDALLAYGSRVRWNEEPPMPARWTKQMGFQGPGSTDQPNAIFWRDDCRQLPVESDWHDEVRRLLD